MDEMTSVPVRSVRLPQVQLWCDGLLVGRMSASLTPRIGDMINVQHWPGDQRTVYRVDKRQRYGGGNPSGLVPGETIIRMARLEPGTYPVSPRSPLSRVRVDFVAFGKLVGSEALMVEPMPEETFTIQTPSGCTSYLVQQVERWLSCPQVAGDGSTLVYEMAGTTAHVVQLAG